MLFSATPLHVPAHELVPVSKKEQGVYSYIAYSIDLEELLFEKYARLRCCLKVFKKPANVPLDEYKWGHNPLVDCTKIQNLFARHQLAPPVYDIVRVGDHYAQVTEYANHFWCKYKYDGDPSTIPDIKHEYLLDTRWDMNPKNWINGAMVDFQAWRWTKPELYEQRLIDLAYKHGAWGSRSEPYQSIPGLDTPSQRDLGHRCEAMRLDEIDFTGKSVLDVGCNLGSMCIEASGRGAKSVVGVDLSHVTDVAFEISNWTGWWNIDYTGAHLPAERGKIEGEFDVVFVLSAKQTQPFPWVFEHCAGVLYVEGHVPQKEGDYRPMLEEYFPVVETMDSTRDHGPRPLFRCRR